VLISMLRFPGSQSENTALRYSPYLPAVSARLAGIFGTPSTTKLSGGVTTASCPATPETVQSQMAPNNNAVRFMVAP
jgi:uncharacterized protein (DUF1499 family)